MMHEPIDLRVRRTQKALQNAFITLIEERGFDAITVGDIAERAMVNRATFYRHYQDKYALVETIFEEAINTLVRELGPPHDVLSSTGAEQPAEALVHLFEHIAKQERLYRVMLGKKGSSWFTSRMRDYFIQMATERELLREQLPSIKGTLRQVKMPEDIAIVFLANTFISMLGWWLENETRYSPQQMTRWFLLFALHGYVSVRGFEGHTVAEEG